MDIGEELRQVYAAAMATVLGCWNLDAFVMMVTQEKTAPPLYVPMAVSV